MIGTLRTVALDAPDARKLAGFYAALGGWTEAYADEQLYAWLLRHQRGPAKP